VGGEIVLVEPEVPVNSELDVVPPQLPLFGLIVKVRDITSSEKVKLGRSQLPLSFVQI
jgi:hypothetical protein